MNEPSRITYRVLITGHVQGVCFRDWTKSKANQLGIAGWVRNRKEGSVEAVISGSREHIEEILLAFENGPPAAKVESIQVNLHRPPQVFFFYQRSTL